MSALLTIGYPKILNKAQKVSFVAHLSNKSEIF
jgi:hypothetical protein